jgi:hypothetical protein
MIVDGDPTPFPLRQEEAQALASSCQLPTTSIPFGTLYSGGDIEKCYLRRARKPSTIQCRARGYRSDGLSVKIFVAVKTTFLRFAAEISLCSMTQKAAKLMTAAQTLFQSRKSSYRCVGLLKLIFFANGLLLTGGFFGIGGSSRLPCFALKESNSSYRRSDCV